MVRDAGNDVLAEPTLDAITVFEANQGNVVFPTFVSLKVAYSIRLPSGEGHNASDDWNISSVKGHN